MNNSNYNSLAQDLIKQGILKSEETSPKEENLDNLFGIVPDEDMNNSPFIEKPISKEIDNEGCQQCAIDNILLAELLHDQKC